MRLGLGLELGLELGLGSWLGLGSGSGSGSGLGLEGGALCRGALVHLLVLRDPRLKDRLEVLASLLAVAQPPAREGAAEERLGVSRLELEHLSK
eukprot:scaffold39231_cov60-Phaeocystis_antarctica.AAC.1